MITFTKDGGTKLIAENSPIISILKEQGWVEVKETKKKDTENAKSSSTGN